MIGDDPCHTLAGEDEDYDSRGPAAVGASHAQIMTREHGLRPNEDAGRAT